jgi:glycosyltransferase involved in cell wall biosynthesis
VVRDLAIGQRANGHRVCVLALLDLGGEDHPLVRELVAADVEVSAVGLAPRAYRAERSAVRELIARFRPQVVHTHGARVDVLDAPVARRAGVPTVTTVHGFTGGDWKNRLYEYLQLRAFRRNNAVIAVSATLAKQLVASGIQRDLVHTVPNAWAGSWQPASPNEARALMGVSGARGPVIGWVGRLTREKGADVFIEAIARLADLAPTCVIVGDGPERARLEQLAAKLGARERVRWTGVVRDADRLLTAFDVLALSSRTEGTPMILFEAIAAGVPVVASAVGGIPDVVGDTEAILVPSEDVDALAAALRRVLSDPDGAHNRATAASSRLAKHFGPGPWLERYYAIYRRVIAAA